MAYIMYNVNYKIYNCQTLYVSSYSYCRVLPERLLDDALRDF